LLGRKKARIVEENISMEDWEKHFLELLEGEKGRKQEKKKNGERSREELGEEKIEFQLKKIKKGIDDIIGEAWFYSDGQIRERFKELLKRYGKKRIFRKNGGK